MTRKYNMIWRILKVLQGFIINGAHAVVDQGAAEQNCHGKDPVVIRRISLKPEYIVWVCQLHYSDHM